VVAAADLVGVDVYGMLCGWKRDGMVRLLGAAGGMVGGMIGAGGGMVEDVVEGGGLGGRVDLDADSRRNSCTLKIFN